MDSSDTDPALTRRGLMRAGAGATAGLAVASASTSVAADLDAYDGYLADEGTWGGVTIDGSGRPGVTVDVGAAGNDGFHAFAPAALLVEPGTTVRWRWTGDGGGHNVVHDVEEDDRRFDSSADGQGHDDRVTAEEGFVYEVTFEAGDEGVYPYVCTPHRNEEMKGVIVVGEDSVETDLDAFLTTPQPDLGGFLDDANEFRGVENFRGLDEVHVDVGAGPNGLAFGPAAIHVDDGTTVVWEWTGEGGGHNVVAEEGEFDSGDPETEAGTTFEHTFEEVTDEDSASENVHNYVCEPHVDQQMLGSVVVGDNYPVGEDTFSTTAVLGGAGAFGLVGFLGLTAYREFFETHE